MAHQETRGDSLRAAAAVYMEGYEAMLQRRAFPQAQACFIQAFRLAKGSPSRSSYLLIVESLLKVAECQLAQGLYPQCYSLCTFLMPKEARLNKPALRHRLHLVRGLAAAGRGDWPAAAADLRTARVLCPAAKMRAMATILQRVDNLRRQALSADSSASCSTCLPPEAVTACYRDHTADEEVVQQLRRRQQLPPRSPHPSVPLPLRRACPVARPAVVHAALGPPAADATSSSTGSEGTSMPAGHQEQRCDECEGSCTSSPRAASASAVNDALAMPPPPPRPAASCSSTSMLSAAGHKRKLAMFAPAMLAGGVRSPMRRA